MKIAISSMGYPEQRNIVVDPQNDYVNCKKKNTYLYINAIRNKLLKKNKKFIFKPLPGMLPADVKVIHLFNEVASTSTPWIATFETEIPRVLPVPGVAKTKNPELHQLLRLAAEKSCVRLIAISEATRQIQKKLLTSFPAWEKILNDKLCVLHPPQALLATIPREVNHGKLIFTFVGNEFYRKGGAEVVLAFSALADAGLINGDHLQVNLIGDLSRKHNIAHRDWQDTADFHRHIEACIAKYPFFIHHNSLPNAEVMKLLAGSDVGLLPTWQDTYGFSVLEMQASGCPVITTNVRALAEINPESAGWLITCPLSDMYEFVVNSENAKNTLRQAITEQLKTHIISALETRQSVVNKSVQALERIRRDHDPVAFKQQLNAIYLAAVC
ncbi:glycosyltransferase [Erwinia psidii]|uniref:glycosyltransferase n=1 Tax=Erwinia psidii TaxID=69224 RepID=UPI00226B0B45|nr:glycosyltransferase [Erwinia psidii]MCX8961315.1 glycosyltransferase [Erwinia psidii]